MALAKSISVLRLGLCVYLSCAVIYFTFRLSYSSHRGLADNWFKYTEIYKIDVDLVIEKQKLEEHLRKLESGETMPIIDDWNIEVIRLFVMDTINTERFYVQDSCSDGSFTGAICSDPTELSKEELLYLCEEDPKFKAHYANFAALMGHNGSSKSNIKYGLTSISNSFDLSAKKLSKIRKDILLCLAILAWHYALVFSGIYGMFVKSSSLQLKLLGLSMVLYIFYFFITFSQTSLMIFETHPKDQLKSDGAFISVIFSDVKVWSILMILFHQILILVYLIMYQKWLKIEKMRKDKQEEDLNKLFFYCKTGEKDKVKDIIHQYYPEIDVNLMKYGENILHIATKGNHTGIVQMLVTNFDDKLDVSLRDPDGYDAFDLAVIKKNIDIFNILLKHSSPSLSSLILAIRNDQVKMIQPLLSKIPSSKMADVIQPLNGFCDQLVELRNKELPKNHKRTLQSNVNINRMLILDSLEASEESGTQNLMSLEERARIVKEMLTCPKCHEVMKRPKQVFACSKDDHICSDCRAEVTECPICHEDFAEKQPSRRFKTEQLIARLLGQKV